MERGKRRQQFLRDMSKTWLLQRLKSINLSAVPFWLGPCVSRASRYRHSLAVGRLSLFVSGGTESDQLLLTAAAALHDVGNGPFPHISDQLMSEMLGFSHEGALRFAFENSPIKDSLTLEKYGLDLTEISSVLEGRHHLSPLLHGFPDLDNADNIYRFMTTIPGRPLGEPSYHPFEIGYSISLDQKHKTIPEDIRRRWLRDYERIYVYLWNDRANMVCWTMLGRALRLLREELTPRFFTMDNREAFRLMMAKLPSLASGLRRKEFEIILDRKYSYLRGEAVKLSDPTNLRELEDELCEETGLEDWSIGLTVDQPLIREKPDHWRVYLVTYGGNGQPKAILEDILSSSEPFTLATRDSGERQQA